LVWLISLAHWFGSAVCDQLVTHSYAFGGVVLPLCARCSGMYLGALVTIGFLAWRRPRAMGLPRPWMLLALLLFFFAWAGDGVNSFLSVIPTAPHLYPPANILRLVTGTLMGITIGSLAFVMFNASVWSAPDPAPIFATRSEFFALLGLGAVVVVIVQSEWSPLLYPLTLASLAAILILHTGLMAAMVASAWRHRTAAWRGAIPALGLGLGIALAYLDLLALGRLLLSLTLGLPV
jgi:uncharacterized membrane protein